MIHDLHFWILTCLHQNHSSSLAIPSEFLIFENECLILLENDFLILEDIMNFLYKKIIV